MNLTFDARIAANGYQMSNSLHYPGISSWSRFRFSIYRRYLLVRPAHRRCTIRSIWHDWPRLGYIRYWVAERHSRADDRQFRARYYDRADRRGDEAHRVGRAA